MKKSVSICLVIVILASVAALASCSLFQGSGNSYKGSASEYYYVSANEAIEAYLSNELSGEDSAAVYVSHQKEKDLTEREIEKLDLNEKYGHTVKSAEQVSVKYAMENYVDDNWQLDSQKLTRNIYLIAYTDNTFRYFATPVKTGETLTTSYMNYLFDSEKYLNSTMNSSIKLQMTMNDGTKADAFSIEMTNKAKFTESAFWFEMGGKQSGLNINDSEQSYEMYAWEDEQSLMMATKVNGKWGDVYENSSHKKVSELIRPVFDVSFDGFDATYFEKTSDGYQIKAEKVETWFSEYFKNINISQGIDIEEMLQLRENFKVSYNVTVRNDRISKLTISVSFNVLQDGQILGLTLSASNEFTDFGSTKVTVPQEVLNKAS